MKWCRRLIEVSRETVLEGVETNHWGRMCQDHGVLNSNRTVLCVNVRYVSDYC
jgi:hypothetical protein